MAKQIDIEALAKSLDEIIESVDELYKGELGPVDAQLSPSGADGDPVSPQDSKGGLGMEKAIPPELADKDQSSEGAEDEADEDDGKDDKHKESDSKDEDKADDKESDADAKDEDESGDDDSDEHFEKGFMKMMQKWGMTGDKPGVSKSDDSDFDLKKSQDDLAKSVDERLSKMAETISSLVKTVERIAKAPQTRRSVSGLQPVERLSKSEEGTALTKHDALDKLLNLQKSGDKRITSYLVAKVEADRSEGWRDLVKSIVS